MIEPTNINGIDFVEYRHCVELQQSRELYRQELATRTAQLNEARQELADIATAIEAYPDSNLVSLARSMMETYHAFEAFLESDKATAKAYRQFVIARNANFGTM